MVGRRIRRARSGGVHLRLESEERAVLASLPAQLRELLDQAPGDPSLARLSPPAYTDDPEREHEYQRLMSDDLLQRRLAALTVLEETAGADRLDEEQAHGWLSALNDLRLVLGTRLDVSEDMAGADIDPADPRAPGLALYAYLSWLQDQLVDALSSGR